MQVCQLGICSGRISPDPLGPRVAHGDSDQPREPVTGRDCDTPPMAVEVPISHAFRVTPTSTLGVASAGGAGRSVARMTFRSRLPLERTVAGPRLSSTPAWAESLT